MYTTVSYDNLDTYLAGLAANTQDTPYEIEISNVTVSFLHGYSVASQGTLQYALQNNATKYVSLKFEAPAELDSIGFMCYGCKSLVGIVVTGMENVTVAWNAFYACTSLVAADVSCMESLMRAHDMFRGCSSLTSVDISASGGLTETTRMFYRCTSLASVNLPTMADVTDAEYMFYSCMLLTSVDVSGMSAVTNVQTMFNGCSALASVDVSGMTSATNAIGMFNGCSALTTIDVSDMTNVTEASGMFQDCTSLTSISLPTIASVTNASDMFNHCTHLMSVDVSGMTRVTDARGMFRRCTRLTEIHGWSVPPTADMTDCFSGCTALEAIYVPEPSPSESSWHAWDIRKDTANNQSTVTVYNPDGTSNSVSVPSAGTYTMKVTDKVDELLFSPSEGIPAATIQKMLQTKAPVTAKDALDPTKDNFALLAKDRSSARTNVTTDVIEAGNKLPPTSEAVQAAIGGAIIPTGTILNYGGTVAPEGFVLCIGQTALREDYAGLISWAIRNNVIGENKLFGEGDGSTTFVFPDLRECVLVGAGENTTYVTGNSDVVIAAHDVYNVGEFKDDQLQGHEHNYMGHNNIWKRGMDNIVALVDETKKKTSGMVSDGTNGTPRTGSTTHGKQIGINYIIKF